MTSRYLTTARAKAEINRIRPKVTQAERVQLNSKDLIKLRSLAVQPLTNTFDLPTCATDEDLLENTHSINTLIDDFVKRLQYYDMYDAFEVLFPTDYKNDGTLTSPTLKQNAANENITNDLTQNYFTLTMEQVQRHVLFLRTYGQDYDLQSLDWSKELLENSCFQDLREKVNDRIKE